MIDKLERLHTEYQVFHRCWQHIDTETGSVLVDFSESFITEKQAKAHIRELVERQEGFREYPDEFTTPDGGDVLRDITVSEREVFASPWKMHVVDPLPVRRIAL